MVYQRTPEQKRHDLANARAYEDYVAIQVGVPVHTRFDARDDLDIWHPGWMLEIKEKNQPLTERWHLLDGVEERNLFVLDELTVRKALSWYPGVFLLLRDNAHDHHLPEDQRQPRLFLAPIWEIVAVKRERVDRGGKGKWILDLTDFTRLADEAHVPEFAHHALTEQKWKQSHCLGGSVEQV
mgnify:CR=1 FL=1